MASAQSANNGAYRGVSYIDSVWIQSMASVSVFQIITYQKSHSQRCYEQIKFVDMVVLFWVPQETANFLAEYLTIGFVDVVR